MGHVSPGPFPPAGSGSHLPRRQHRRAGALGAQALTDERRRLGSFGERVAAWYLSSRGLSILAANVEVPGGEIDILARDGRTRVAVEVRTVTADSDPIDAIDEVKRLRVARLASRAGAQRIDLIGVAIGNQGLDIHWLPGQAR
ncbi:MAG: YraN family protein [Acidimicrobiia bacterium]